MLRNKPLGDRTGGATDAEADPIRSCGKATVPVLLQSAWADGIDLRAFHSDLEWSADRAWTEGHSAGAHAHQPLIVTAVSISAYAAYGRN